MHSLLWGQMLSKGLPPMWHHATSCDQHDEVVMYISSFQPEFQHPKKLSVCTVLKAEAWLSHCAQRLKNNRPRKASAQKVKNNRLGKEGAYHMELCQTLSCPTNDIPQPQKCHRYQTKTRKDRRKRRTNLAAAGAALRTPLQWAAQTASGQSGATPVASHGKSHLFKQIAIHIYTYHNLISIHYYLTLCDIVWNSAHHWVHNGYRYPFALCKVTLDVALFLNPQCLELASPPRVRNSDHARLSTIQVELDSTNRK
jgi:hypothetical protein